jgi:hypothetical protein
MEYFEWSGLIESRKDLIEKVTVLETINAS